MLLMIVIIMPSAFDDLGGVVAECLTETQEVRVRYITTIGT